MKYPVHQGFYSFSRLISNKVSDLGNSRMKILVFEEGVEEVAFPFIAFFLSPKKGVHEHG